MSSIQSKLWQRAAEHWRGDGVQNGVGNASYRRPISQLKLVSQGERLSELIWPRVRVKSELGSSFDDLCPRCQKYPETAFHRAWDCEDNVGAAAYEQSQDLVAE
eukprot:8023349-Pyramimonas_sp.AAC.1